MQFVCLREVLMKVFWPQFDMCLGMTLNSSFSCLNFPSTGNTGMCHYAWPSKLLLLFLEVKCRGWRDDSVVEHILLYLEDQILFTAPTLPVTLADLCLFLDSVDIHTYLAYVREHKLRHISKKKSCEVYVIFTY